MSSTVGMRAFDARLVRIRSRSMVEVVKGLGSRACVWRDRGRPDAADHTITGEEACDGGSRVTEAGV